MRKYLHLILLVTAMMISTSAKALDLVWVEGENVVNVTGVLPFTATFTVTKTDRIYIGSPEAFASVECNGSTYDYKYVTGTEEGAYKYEFDAVAGQVVTIKSDGWMNPGASVFISQGYKTLQPVSFTPTQGSIFPWTGQGMVTASFNKNCSATGVKVKCPKMGMKEYTVVDQLMLAGSNKLSCCVTNALEQAFADGLQPEDPFLVEFSGIKDGDNNKYANTGVLTIQYRAPKPQGRLVSATVEDGKSIEGYEFKSWFPTDETAGLFVFEFSKDINTTKTETNIELTMGNLDQQSEGRFYRERITPKIEGNKIIVDARGKLRSLSRLFPSVDFEAEEEEGAMDERFEIKHDAIFLALNNIYDVDGNPMLSPGQGTIGTFSFTFPYREIVDMIACEGDRPEDQDGNAKKIGDDVRIWIDQTLKSKDKATIYFNMYDERLGVDENEKPIYAQGSVEVAGKDIETISEDEVEGSIISFTIPELKGSIDITEESGSVTTLTNCPPAEGSPLRIVVQVTTKEGMPHDLVFSYIYSETNGIATIVADAPSSKAIYNTLGQRVGVNANGIIIRNGKKILSK